MSVIKFDPSHPASQTAPEFGQALRHVRRHEGMTQEELVRRTGHQFARPTLANIETGRERPSKRVFQAIVSTFPDWESLLRDPFERSRWRPKYEEAGARGPAGAHGARTLGGPYALERLQIVYTFRHSRAPEEIIETRHIRALGGGGSRFTLKLKSGSEAFETEDEVLWGGRLESSARYHADGAGTTYLQQVDFGKTLRKGEAHDFAIRHWVARDPEPDNEALFSVTLPAAEVALHLKFHGPQRPRRITRIGPLADRCLLEDARTLETGTALDSAVDVSEYFERPEPGALYGVVWEW